MKTFIVSLSIIFFLTFFRLFSFFFSPLSAEALAKAENPPNFSAFARLNRPTNFIDQTIKTIYPEPQASLLSGILVGTKANMPKDFYSALQKTGTLHIIALSGTNITMLISFFNLLFKSFGRIKSSLFSIIAIIVFILFVGPSASVIRAGIMGSLNLIAIIFGRRNIQFFSLGVAALIMIIISPQIIIDIGFQLSFLASFGIMIIGNSNNPKKPQSNNIMLITLIKLINLIKNELKITLSAQIFTLPVILFNFHGLSVISPLTNVLVGWTIPYLMAGGFILVAFVHFFNLLTFKLFDLSCLVWILSWFLLPLLNWFIWVIKFTGSLSFSYLKI